ncbi:MAG TPA: universal stress protein [Gaiellaceae bacterium]|jgi:nucleotide-binding universal stress UspA family protein|nr:universal stress protein [Gaiellaceae bacterium]
MGFALHRARTERRSGWERGGRNEPEEEEMMGGTIVCGVSESPDELSAAELARALGARLGLRLVLVHVVDGVPPGTDESLTARQRQSGAERILDEIAREIGNGTEKRIMLGNRAEALAQVAAEEGADLIVIGSRPTGLGNRKLRSTLARELEAATPIPVAVAPPRTRRRADRRLAAATEAASR